MWETEQFWGTIDFHSRKKNTMEVNGAPELLCFPQVFQEFTIGFAEKQIENVIY